MVTAKAESLTTLAHNINYFTKSTLCCFGTTFAWTPFYTFRLLVNKRIYVNSVILLKVCGIGKHQLEDPFRNEITPLKIGT